MARPGGFSRVIDVETGPQGALETDESHLHTIDSIIDSPNAELAKCILTWVVSAPRPLAVDELTEAVSLDIGQTLTSSPLSQQLERITGPLIVVDGQSRVRITHETTSAFLTQPRIDGVSWIDRPTAHARVAELCLEILCGDQFAPPKHQRGGVNSDNTPASPLSIYAAAHFSHHLARSSLTANGHMSLLDKFLRTNVLTWIEKLAQSGDLSGLLEGARGIETYLTQRNNCHTVGDEAQAETARVWVTEIHRLVAVFHSAILAMPSSVHFLLPQLCPRGSITRKLFGTPTEGLRIVGQLDEDWDDRLTCYLFPERALSVTCCEHLVAIGVSNSNIHLYSAKTFEFVAALPNGRRPGFLAFDSTSSFLVSCDLGILELWDPCSYSLRKLIGCLVGLEASKDDWGYRAGTGSRRHHWQRFCTST
ncbi:uncharacterized protein B0H64DRAFT_419291 [Chaetomium fimeti]|uniref:GPI inositol-deacylase winged helix domain-containing protein n=1 Tax=Chaetomium fimeti TaxID=1854472 RepID=A0AAE0LQJ1_9PEZI|nr:hypothetical protein B0H64DRAFT_419291 [Chaetomium fimeti]